jgi:hypothetical protein
MPSDVNTRSDCLAARHSGWHSGIPLGVRPAQQHPEQAITLDDQETER